MQLTLVKKVLSDHDHACTLHITCATPSVAPRRYTVNPRSLLPRWTFYNTMAQQYRFGTVDTRSLVRLGIVSCRVHTCPFPPRHLGTIVPCSMSWRNCQNCLWASSFQHCS